jgi:2-polyprenyl-6-methoxyphenol hydroxylase-like FAD-dependent oxidoreductase
MTDVAIAGGGPVGLALAVTLARCGIAVTVFEQRWTPTPLEESRAITWMPGALEFLDWLEMTERFAAIGMPRHVHEFWSRRRRLVSVRYDRLDHRHPYTLMLPQHHTERLLQEAAEASGLVEIRRGHRVRGADQDRMAAVLTVDGPDGQYTVPAPWAVGADGARSTIRGALGVAQRWRDYGSDTAVADFDLSCDLPVDRSRIVLDPRRPHGFFPFARDRWRLVYRINPGEDRAAMITGTRATQMLAQFLPEAAPRELLWSSAFRLGQGQSRRYRSGRWLLVGDAAHSMGPSAGAGMMIGILGAWRLGLRLAEAITRGADEPLNRYEVEQRAAAEQVQRDNARIFANIALRSAPVAALRSAGLGTVGRLPRLSGRMAVSEALLHLPHVIDDGRERGQKKRDRRFASR